MRLAARRLRTPVVPAMTKKTLRPGKLGLGCLGLSAAWLISPGATAAEPVAPEDAGFNRFFLQRTGPTPVDINRFNKTNSALPGHYRADLFVNLHLLDTVDVRLADTGHGRVLPCIDATLLEQAGVDQTRLSADATLRLQTSPCPQLDELVPQAQVVFDNSEQSLTLSVPQIALRQQVRGYVDPALWDDGISAALLGYNANAYRSRAQGSTETQTYMGLSSGFNLGPWRLRHMGNLSSGSQQPTRYQSVQTTLQRSLRALRSQFTLGYTFTDGALFDSYGLRGIQLATDERMYPDSQRGYAPIVRGLANSNAHVRVRQNGNIIYEATVAAGAFEITDLYATGYGGDLEVTVTEADGTEHVSTVPYAAAVNALRPGISRYALAAGWFRNTGLDTAPRVAQFTLQHGLSNLLTAYGGLNVAEGYHSGLAGAALNTRWGAIGLDLTLAQTRLQHQPDRHGKSLRLSYTETVPDADTQVSLSASHFSTDGFLNLPDAMALRELDQQRADTRQQDARRGRIELALNQTLADPYGSVYATGSVQNYWNRDGHDVQLAAGYNNHWRKWTYGITLNRQLDVTQQRWDNRVMLNIGVPLTLGSQPNQASATLQHDARGNHFQQFISGATPGDHPINYAINAGYDAGSASLSANASYIAPVAALSASVSKGGSYAQSSASLAGTLLAYRGGVVATSAQGDGLVVVEAAGAKGARVIEGNHVYLDTRGHALLTGMQPFSRNYIDIDPKGLPLNLSFKATQQSTVPTAGAVTLARFETRGASGRAAILTASRPDGTPLPFGAEVLDAQGGSVGTVAQGGRIIARNLAPDQAALTVKWGDAADQQCALSFMLPEAKTRAFIKADAVCD